MTFLRQFVMQTLRGMIGKEPDYQVMLTALRHHEKGVLEESDLVEIQGLIDEKNKPIEPEIPIEENEVI